MSVVPRIVTQASNGRLRRNLLSVDSSKVDQKIEKTKSEMQEHGEIYGLASKILNFTPCASVFGRCDTV